MKVLGCDLLEERVEVLKDFGVDAVVSLPQGFRPNAVFLTAGADKTVEIAIKPCVTAKNSCFCKHAE